MGKGKGGHSALATPVLRCPLGTHMDVWNSQSLELRERSRQGLNIFVQSAYG